jgi:phage FluMu gp28-like protein
MCNPLGAATNHIVDWSALERCRFDYQIERAHLEHERVLQLFSHHNSSLEKQREQKIHEFLRSTFPKLLAGKPGSSSRKFRLGFDVAASGVGDLGAIYIYEPNGDELWLRALVTTRTEDWHFIRTVLYFFLRHLPSLEAAGDSSGLGRQICWQAAEDFSSRFLSVNLSSKKHDLGFALMNQLATAQKRLPTNQPDIASDFFALRKVFSGNKWAFSEAQNPLNLPSHCDIAWAGALASHVHTERKCTFGACVLMEDGSVFNGKEYRYPGGATLPHEHHLLWSEDPSIWRPLAR